MTPRLTIQRDRTITLRTTRTERIIATLTGSRGRFGWRDRNGMDRGAFEMVGDVMGDILRRTI